MVWFTVVSVHSLAMSVTVNCMAVTAHSARRRQRRLVGDEPFRRRHAGRDVPIASSATHHERILLLVIGQLHELGLHDRQIRAELLGRVAGDLLAAEEPELEQPHLLDGR